MKLLLFFLILTEISVSTSYSQNPADSATADTSKTGTQNQPISFESWSTGVKVNADEFNKGAVFSPLQLIQGKVPGFNINCTNVNDPNPDIQTQLRGASSVYLKNKPLYIVNGVVLDDASFIPVESIESIEVLKNISETALYGVRGADGVIIIHTKKNLPGTFNVSYSTYGYIEKLGKSEYMNANEWRQLKADWANSSYSELQSYASNVQDYHANTDWLKEISQQKLSQSHFLSFSGNYHKTSYVANVGYDNYNGIIQKIDNRKLSGQLYISQLAFKDKLEASLYVTGSDRNYSAINKNVFINDNYNLSPNYTNIIHIANQYNPSVPVNGNDSSYGIHSINPLQLLNLPTDKHTQNNSLVNVSLSYSLTNNLGISVSYSIHKRTDKNTYSEHNDSLRYGEYNELKEKILHVNLSYNKSIRNHHFNFLVNYSNQSNNTEMKQGDLNARFDTVIIFNPHPEYQILGNSTSLSYVNYNIVNISASIKYDYKNKYFLSAGMLQEKSPLYKPQISTEGLWSFKTGWAVKREKFLEQVNWLNEFTIFAGYGATKRQYSLGYVQNVMYSPDMHGERLQEYNLGAKISVFSNRLWFTMNYYNLKTNDGINQEDIRVLGNGSMLMQYNSIGISNKGWELSLIGQPIVNPFSWTVYGNFSRNNNKVLTDVISSGFNLKNLPVGSFEGNKFAGFSNTNNMLVYDNNGNKVLNYSLPFNCIGNGLPKSFWELTNNFQYKQFELSVTIRGALGFNIRNKEYFSVMENGKLPLNELNFKNDIRKVDPRALLSWSNVRDIELTDYIVEKGNYAKIDNICLSYTLTPQKNIFKSLKFYIGCNNVALITKFSGGDPEMAGINGSDAGSYYYANYPFTRIFVLGLKCSL
jgi:Outer membrane receptor proteins, mostly Fe transport